MLENWHIHCGSIQWVLAISMVCIGQCAILYLANTLHMIFTDSTRIFVDAQQHGLKHCNWNKGEHECTRGWPRSVPAGLQTVKIQTQICASNRVQVIQIHRSSTRENTSTCYLIKKSDTIRNWTSNLLPLKASDALDHWVIYTCIVKYKACSYPVLYYMTDVFENQSLLDWWWY